MKLFPVLYDSKKLVLDISSANNALVISNPSVADFLLFLVLLLRFSRTKLEYHVRYFGGTP